jgi:ABC-2 type transport system permease protein
VNTRRVVVTSRRVLLQLCHDPRTLALMVGVPCVLMALLRYIYDGQPLVFERVGPMLLAIFPFVVMFVVTSVAMLRERTSGTLELLLTKPLSKGELLAGYALGFGVAAVVQVAAASVLTKGPLCTAVLWCWRWWR